MGNTHRIVEKRGANHVLHLILSVFTGGLWVPFWIAAAMKGRKSVTRVPAAMIPQPAFRPEGDYRG